MNKECAREATVPLLAQARQLTTSGHLEAAGAAYETIVGQYPDCGEAWFGLGVLGMQIGDNESAADFFGQAIAVGLLDVACQINLGEAYRRLGRVPEAIEVLSIACQRAPNAFDAHLNLAAALAQGGQFAGALEQAAEACTIAPTCIQAWLTKAEIHRNLSQEEAVESCFAHVLMLEPNHLPAVLGLAEARRVKKDFVAAIDGFQFVLKHDDRHLAALTGLGAIAVEQKNFVSAEAMYRRALEVDPDYREAVYGLGVSLLHLEKYDLAETVLRHAIDLAPEKDDSWLQLGEVLFYLKRYDEAMSSYEQGLSLNPRSVGCMAGIGNALLHLERIPEAIATYRKAMRLAPEHFQVQANIALAHFDFGRFAEAERYGVRSVELSEGGDDSDLAYQNLAQIQLRRGRLKQGWESYEKRRSRLLGNRFPFPEWQGESLVGKRILIWQDQGLGDVILFGTIYQEIIDEASGVIIECERKLVPIIRRSFPRATVVPRNAKAPHPLVRTDVDCHCPGGSLPLWRRSNWASFPRAPKSILKVDKARANYWRERLAQLDTNIKVGICWRSMLSKGRRELAYSTLADWGGIFSLPGVTLINLQYDQCDAELAEAETLFGREIAQFKEIDMLDDIDETTALISQLDAVISAPTSVARMSAGVGTPTLMATLRYDWTGLGRRKDPWLRQLKQYQRSWNQSWSEVLVHVADDLRKRFRLSS